MASPVSDSIDLFPSIGYYSIIEKNSTEMDSRRGKRRGGTP
jgi:hypothetical protein